MKKSPVCGLFRGLVMTALLFALSAGLSAQENRRFALVIGNGEYRHVESLMNPANDAADIAAKLRGLGYQVELRLNAGNADMGRAIADYTRRLSSHRGNEGFFWYAGHGVQIDGENYLLPVDIDADDDLSVVYGSYPLNRLLQALEQNARNKLNVVVLDACRDNPFKNRAGGSRSLSRGLVTVEHPPQDLFIMFSTAPGTVAADGERGRRNSPFAEAFLKHMESPEILPVVASHITRETMELTGGRQRPFQNGSIISEIYYSLNPAANAAAGTSSPPSAPGTSAAGVNAAAPIINSAAPVEQRALDTMVLINGGTFTMGSPAAEPRRDPDEQAHEARVDSFYLGRYEVSQAEYEALMGSNPSYFRGARLPVEQVSWFEAVRYCNALSLKEGLKAAYTIEGDRVSWDRSADGYRLPTEAEWEYACRAGTTGPFNTGEFITVDQANFNGEAAPYNNGPRGINRAKTGIIGSFAPNPWGLHDMHGNVYEWCWEYYHDYARPGGGDTPSDLQRSGALGTSRIVRGGSWYTSAFFLRSAYRDSANPSSRNSYTGFRAARNL